VTVGRKATRAFVTAASADTTVSFAMALRSFRVSASRTTSASVSSCPNAELVVVATTSATTMK
jgi:hypothetical protein